MAGVGASVLGLLDVIYSLGMMEIDGVELKIVIKNDRDR